MKIEKLCISINTDSQKSWFKADFFQEYKHSFVDILDGGRKFFMGANLHVQYILLGANGLLRKRHIVIPFGFVCDGASIPKIVRFFMYFILWFRYVIVMFRPAGIIHDAIYRLMYEFFYREELNNSGTNFINSKLDRTPISRKEADLLMLAILNSRYCDLKKYPILNKLCYYGVRAFGWLSFKKK